jgi:hypothetical protein
MNREDIIRMAREVELINKDYDLGFLNKFTDKVERFAALVASAAVRETSAEYRMGWNDGQIAEREACAELCIEIAPSTKTMTAYKVLHEASKAILARGQA